MRDLLHELARQDALLEPLADVRHDPLAHELAHGVADRLLLVVEQRVDREEVARVELGLLGGGRHACMVEQDRRDPLRGGDVATKAAVGGGARAFALVLVGAVALSRPPIDAPEAGATISID